MSRVGAFELERPVAHGGMAVVWRARHIAHSSPAAVKVISKRGSESPRHRREFFNELRAIARLDHPNIVRVLDYGDIAPNEANDALDLAEGTRWLAMEWVDGRTLGEATTWTWSRLRAATLDVLDALAHAHARGVIHRDLKPGNVMFSAGSAHSLVKLTDFGIALSGDDEEDDGKLRGTPRYMAPEQILARPHEQGPWTDLYALGCMLWSMVTGQAPFDDDDYKQVLRAHLSQPLPPFEPRLAVPDRLEDVLRHLLARTPQNRFQFAADVAVALRDLGDVADEAEHEPAEWEKTIVETPTVALPDAMAELVDDGVRAPRVAVKALPRDWRVRDPAPARSGTYRAGINLFGIRKAPFVDRNDLRDALWSEFAATLEAGTSHAVVLDGSLGSGKSRLASWLCERAHELGVARAFWAYHTEEGGERDGVGPMVRRALGLRGLDFAEALARVGEVFFGDETESDVRLFDSYAFLALSGFAHGKPLSPDERHRAFLRMAELAAAERPIILVFDDVQWGWEAIEMASQLVGQAIPVFVVLTAQSEALRESATMERLAQLREVPGVRSLQVDVLEPDDRRALVQNALALDPGLTHNVAELGGGNPLWTTQILNELVERGALVTRGEVWALADGEQLPVPKSAAEVFARRLGNVLRDFPPAAEHAVAVAAMIGTTFDRDEWLDACGALRIAVPDGLEEALLRRGLLRLADDQYVFAHALAAETLRVAVPEPLRANMHEACLGALDRAGRDGVEDWTRRSWHLVGLGRKHDAASARLEAVERAHRWVEPGHLRALLDAAAEVVLALDDADLVARYQISEARFALKSNMDDAMAWADRVLEHSESPEYVIHARAILASANRLRGNAEVAEPLFREAIDALPADAELRGRTLIDYGLLLKWMGRIDEALEAYREASRILNRGSTRFLHFRAVRYMGDAEFQRGNIERAKEIWTEAAAGARETNDRVSLAAAANLFAEADRMTGNYAEATVGYGRALELFASAGHWGTVTARLNLALARLGAGHVDKAREGFHEAASEMRERSLTLETMLCDMGLLACDARDGEFDGVHERFEELVTTIRQDNFTERDLVQLCEWICADSRRDGASALAVDARDFAVEQLQSLGASDAEIDRASRW
jgi:tetratricopeptide (TPR) repeat protein